tara:strand:- start:26 stop:211 length:186 start_codon:yes stop_codon:yes gene_type:complete
MAKKCPENHQICCMADHPYGHSRFRSASKGAINGSAKEKRPQHQQDATGADPTEHMSVFFA